MENNNKVVEITVSWSGIKKNGKTALCTGDKETLKWYNFGKNCPQKPEYFQKGKTYKVLVGEDSYHILYINGLADETGEGGVIPEEWKQDLKASSGVPQGTSVVPLVALKPPEVNAQVSQNPKALETKELLKDDLLVYIEAIRRILDNMEREAKGVL